MVQRDEATRSSQPVALEPLSANAKHCEVTSMKMTPLIGLLSLAVVNALAAAPACAASPPSQKRAQLTSPSALGTVLAQADTNRGPGASDQWQEYRNAAIGLSFKYPPTMLVHERSARAFGLSPDLVIIDLVGDIPANHSIALRFECSAVTVTPEQATHDIQRAFGQHASDPDPHDSLKAVYLDGHEALESVACERNTCQSTVHFLQPRGCDVFSMLGGADANDRTRPPRDGTFPLLSILKTVHFETAK